jgi:hypothetical protein
MRLMPTRRSNGRLRSALVLPVALLAGAALALAAAPAGAASARSGQPGAARPAPAPARAKPVIVYRDLALSGRESATVYSDGLAEVYTANHSSVEYRMLPPDQIPSQYRPGSALPPKGEIIADLSKAAPAPYATGTVEVVLDSGVSATAAARTVPGAVLDRMRQARTAAALAAAAPRYTTSAELNAVLGSLGVSGMRRLFSAASPTALARLTQAAASASGHPVLGLDRAYVVQVSNASVPAAVSKLLASPQVAYAAPDWSVAPMDTSPVTITRSQQARALAAQRAAAAASRRPASGTRGASSPASLPALPTNYALADSMQALLNKPGVDWVPAYETLEARYGQLPGTGETITDVSLGDLDSADLPSSDPCSFYSSVYGATTIVQNGQRYLDLPSMPLIPTYTASTTATLDPTGEVCGVDPYDSEIGLDFAMMSPLPDNLQRPGATGSGFTDLLGIAPGASYRLVVPASSSPTITDIDAAFLAAAQQTPRPDVITASLGFGLDSEGFPSRYLEDDPLTETLVYALVHADHIVVSISANDGLRTSTNAAVAPSGGSAATDVAGFGAAPTNLNNIQFSTTASVDPDSGAIDAGGTTLDDIFAAPPQDPANAKLAAQHAFPEVRWDGFTSFSSGYGSRVNLSAPADNVIAVEHAFGGGPTDVTSDIIGGTSASAQEIGAAAADVLQAARLSGNPGLAGDPLAVRNWLVATGTPVPNVPQADRELNVGPQVDVGRAVDDLIARSGFALGPGVARVAVEQRQTYPGELDAVFETNTDPAAISLAGAGQDDWLTIAPDWLGTPAPGSEYSLTVNGHVLATTPFARLQPQQILTAAGQAFPPASATTVTLTYQGTFCRQGAGYGCLGRGSQQVVTTTIPLTFTAASGDPQPLAPDVPPVVTGSTIGVSYNVANLAGFTDPQLVVSEPGRVNPFSAIFRPSYTQALSSPAGTVQVPVSALQGGGIYGIAIESSPGSFFFTDFAYTRVQDALSDARPAAPLLSAPGSPPSQLLTIPYDGSFTVSWDVRGVPGATGAMLEISAAGPNDLGSYSTFNNPDGTIRDNNGTDSESLYFARLPGPSGSETLSGGAVGLYSAMYHNVRVLPVTYDGSAAGEASDISTISMDGVVPSDGGYASNGFGVNQSGSDGFLTSGQQTASGQILSSVETFDQTTNAITGTVLSADNTDLYGTVFNGTSGIYHGDVGLYQDENLSSGALSYRTLNPVATGTLGGAWTPPSADLPPAGNTLAPAENQATDTTAVLSGGIGPVPTLVFTSDIGANTFGPAYNLAPELSSFTYPFVTGLAQDTSTNTAIIGAADITNLTPPPTIITVNLSNGSMSSFTGVGTGYADGTAVDSQTDTAIVPTINGGIGVYDLATGAATDAQPGGAVYESPTVDASHSVFLVKEIVPPDFEGSTPNNDALSSIVVLGENGQVLQRLERFNFFDISLEIIGHYVQVNPATETGYTLGPGGQELAPFSYGG